MKTQHRFFSKVTMIAMIGIVFFSSCSNDDENYCNRSNLNKNIAANVNPYDVHSHQIKLFFNGIKTILSEIDEDTPYEVYLNKVEELVKANPSTYPTIDTSIYTDADKKFVDHFMDEYLKDASLNGIVKASANAEKELFAMNDGVLTSDLLCLISQIKFTFQYLDEIIIYYAPNYGERMNNCIGNHLDDVFSDNVVAQTVFIAGLPETFLAIAAECAYMAAFEPKHPYCQNNWMSGWRD